MKDSITIMLELKHEDLESYSYLLFEEGALGVNLKSSSYGEAFFSCSTEGVKLLIDKVVSLDFQVINSLIIPETNWLKQSTQVWKALKIGNLTINPVFDVCDSKMNKSETIINILPGLGFGTGHHATTSFIIEELQELKKTDFCPSTALDVGCGSGILAICINKVFKIPVDAIDNDPFALENAKENSMHNGIDNINFTLEPISSLKRSYNLIVANIYAEVLTSMRNDFYRLLDSAGILILSGVMSSLASILISDFVSNQWHLIKHLDNGEWSAVIFKKI